MPIPPVERSMVIAPTKRLRRESRVPGSVASPTVVATAPDEPAASGNVVEFTVGELSSALKRTVEDRFGLVRVRGEISNYRGPHSSGHAYFCLKDDAARIDAVVWKTAFARLRSKPQEGLEVVATGRLTTFPGKSSYQIIIETLEPAGVGALMALLEARRKALAAEGLFDAARKRPLPFLPRSVGVVTSPTGAVIRDILHRLADRFPRDVLVWPVRVQGDSAAAEIAAAIDGFNALPLAGALRRPDVLIVARGGGSLEDLWAFNEEVVVRAAAASAIPLIAAIGHETDWTLIDHASDLRAPTPSGAAEKVVPVRVDLIAAHADLARRHDLAVTRWLDRRRGDVRALVRSLPAAEMVTAVARQRLDRTDERVVSAIGGILARQHLDLVRLGHRLAQQAPLQRVRQRRQHLASLDQMLIFLGARVGERRRLEVTRGGERLTAARLDRLRDLERHRGTLQRMDAGAARAFSAGGVLRRSALDRCGSLLEALSYRRVLMRGFALVRDAAGVPIHSVHAATQAATLAVEFADGCLEVSTAARAKTAGARASNPKSRADGRPHDQPKARTRLAVLRRGGVPLRSLSNRIVEPAAPELVT